MRLILLGTGGPRPDPDRHGSSLAVEIGGEYLLFDCGRGAVMQLVRAGVPLAKVNPLFITHHHYDHISDMGDLMISTWLQGRAEALRVFGPSGTATIAAALVEGVYAKDIRARAEGEPAIGGWKPVEVEEIAAGRIIETENWRVRSEMVEHGQGLAVPDLDWVTLGYRLETDGKVIAISGDTVPCEGLDRLADGADVLVQCCYLAESEVRDDHTRRLVRYLFPTSTQVGDIAQRNSVKRLVLTHFRRKSPQLMQELEQEVRRTFDGEIIVGHDLLTVDVDT